MSKATAGMLRGSGRPSGYHAEELLPMERAPYSTGQPAAVCVCRGGRWRIVGRAVRFDTILDTSGHAIANPPLPSPLPKTEASKRKRACSMLNADAPAQVQRRARQPMHRRGIARPVCTATRLALERRTLGAARGPGRD